MVLSALGVDDNQRPRIVYGDRSAFPNLFVGMHSNPFPCRDAKSADFIDKRLKLIFQALLIQALKMLQIFDEKHNAVDVAARKLF